MVNRQPVADATRMPVAATHPWRMTRHAQPPGSSRESRCSAGSAWCQTYDLVAGLPAGLPAGWEIGAPMSDGVRRALVTAASAGIGRACAGELHAAGWAVTGASRRGTTSGGWAGLVMDVDDDDSVRTGVACMLAGGRIDALVACAGWGLAGRGRAVHDRGGKGPVGDQLLGLRAGSAAGAAR